MFVLGRHSRCPVAMLLRLLLLSPFVTTATASSFMESGDETCILAIVLITSKYTFTGVHSGYYINVCTNPLAVLTLYANGKTYCSSKHFKAGVAALEKSCSGYGSVELLPESNFEANLTAEAIASLPVYGKSDISKTVKQTSAFILSKSWYDLAYRTRHSYVLESQSEAKYGFGMYGYWGAILVYGMIQNFIRRYLEHRRGYVYADAEGSRPATSSTPAFLLPLVPVYSRLRKYFIMPSLLPPYHQRQFWGCSIPTRAESLAVYGFWIYSIITCAVDIPAFKQNITYSNTAVQVWRFVADRTGTLCYFCLPLLWVFSGRNNMFLWLTGWNFGTFNIFHRHIARIATLEAIIHSIGWSAYYPANGVPANYYKAWKRFYWQMGAAATVAMSFLILFSFSFFRRKLYDSFLLVHIILSVLLIAFLYHHTNIYDLEIYNWPFLMPVVAIWGFDRALRLVRQAYCNFYVSRNRSKTLQGTKATVSLDDNADMLTVDVVPGNRNLFMGPGQHYYLYQPFRFFGWENHPFTLASWDQDDSPNGDGDVHLQFLVRPYDGWTKSLRKQCLTAQAGASTSTPIKVSTTLLLEGPYGKSEPLHAFDHVLLIAGGSGIAAVLPYLLDHVRRTTVPALGSTDSTSNICARTRTRSITLVWVERRATYMQSLIGGRLSPILQRDDVHASFYLTTGRNGAASSMASSFTNDVSTSTASTNEKSEPEKGGLCVSGEAGSSGNLTHGAGTLEHGRPNVASIVQREASAIYGSNDRLAVMVCGPSALSDDVRYATARAMETGRDSIEFFEESFGW